MPTRRPFVSSASMTLSPTGPGALGGASSLLRTSLSSTRVAPSARGLVDRPSLLRAQPWAAAQLSLFGRSGASR